MLEDEAELKKIAEQVVANMLASNVAHKKFYTDERVGKEYSILITPNAFEKKLIAIAVLGYPEQVGVWSYTLLQITKISFGGIHGEMPNKALAQIIKFFQHRL